MSTALGAALAALLLVAGCGQKGPLYLPDQTGEVVTRPTQTPDRPPEPPPDKEKESEEEKPPQS